MPAFAAGSVLLGLGLSVAALKCELVVRLLGRDDARACDELERLLEVTAKAGSDLLTVTDQDHRLSLNAEVAAAHDALTSAGVDAAIHVDLGASHGDAKDGEWPGVTLPGGVDTVLATVLREAVTNVLRHADARRCTIELCTSQGAVSMRVINDGVTGGPANQGHREGHPGVRGLVNLAERTGTLGGHVTTHTEGGQFQLTTRLPLPAEA